MFQHRIEIRCRERHVSFEKNPSELPTSDKNIKLVVLFEIEKANQLFKMKIVE